jgi:hypothetical protein
MYSVHEPYCPCCGRMLSSEYQQDPDTCNGHCNPKKKCGNCICPPTFKIIEIGNSKASQVGKGS